MQEAPAWLREIDHTGDIGIEVRADSLEALFARAAWGMFSLLTDVRAVQPQAAQPIRAEAADRDALLAEWLSELNFLHVTEGWLFSRFEIERLSQTQLAATAHGEKVDHDRHPVYTEIKAVTYHDLEIRQDEEAGWHVQVIFDM